MASYNKVILLGNLTRDPELRYTPSGMAVCEIGLAVNDRRKTSEGEWVEEATFVDVTLWAKTAEVVNDYCQKGSALLVDGRLKLDQWETEGQKRSKLRVVGERVQLIGGKEEKPAKETKEEFARNHRYDHVQDNYSGGSGSGIPF